MSSPLTPPSPGSIAVGSLAQAAKHKSRYGAILTLEDPIASHAVRTALSYGRLPPRLVLHFEDFDRDDMGVVVATADQVERAIAFGRTHAGTSLLVHCFRGVGRSAACALAMLADRMGPGREAESVSAMLAIRPESTPNLVVVALADAILGRDGALIAALAAHEASNPSYAADRKLRMDLYEKKPDLFAHHRLIGDSQCPRPS